MYPKYDVTIIGGGFYGLYLADYFSNLKKNVLIVEREDDVMQRASYINQARVHNGYHYPRSTLTALRSRVSFPRFIDEFESCIYKDFENYYMISNKLGNISSKQFEKFCKRIKAPLQKKQSKMNQFINKHMIDEIFQVNEFVFDTIALKKIMMDRIKDKGVEVLCNNEVKKVEYNDSLSKLTLEIYSTDGYKKISSKQAFNCTYSLLNSFLKNSTIPLIPLKHEMAEICIVDVPDELKDVGITVMCGPFFSIIPFPSKNAYSLTHVRYTPHYEWVENNNNSFLNKNHKQSNSKYSAWKKMKLDAKRYIPILENLRYKESMWEVKTTLPSSEFNDARPILFKPNYIMPGFHCVMGGKIDNIYDVLQIIKDLRLDTI